MSRKNCCNECGNVEMKKQNVQNKLRIDWKDYKSLLITSALEITYCQQCGNYAIDGNDAKLIDDAAKHSIAQLWKNDASKIFAQKKILQKDLGRFLGVTEEYLSTVLSGKKVPSVTLSKLLHIAVQNPAVIDMQLWSGNEKN